MNVIITPSAAKVAAEAVQASVIIPEQSIEIDASADALEAAFGNPIIREIVGGESYEGEYTVTPSQEAQTLPTAGCLLTQNVVVNPIPSNYGLITWNGSTLTVS